MIAFGRLKVKVDDVTMSEGSRPEYAMASVELTTRVRDQGMICSARFLGGRSSENAPFIAK